MMSLLKKILAELADIRHVPYWIFLILFAISAAISVAALRQNNLTMIQLRNVVYEADENNGNVNQALNELRTYVYGHMNTDLSSGGNAIKPPIQLKYTYERVQAAEQQKVNSVNSQIYTDAQNYCESQNQTGFSGRTRVPCIEDYVTRRGVTLKAVPSSLYQFDFASPAWSPDLAGWSLGISALLFLAFLISLCFNRLLRANVGQ